MRNWIMAAGVAAIGLGACNTQNTVIESNQFPAQPALTMADVVPVAQPGTPQAKKQQEEFLSDNVKRFKSRKLAAEYYVLQAKRTFNENKTDSAKYLFSRAWLMDSTNNDIYWGYGLVYGQQKEYDKALFILYRALEADKENPRLLTDIATSHLGRFYETSSHHDLLQSKKLLEEAIRLQPDKAEAYYKLAINCYYLSDYRQAWEYLHQSVKKEENIADQAFITALLGKEHDPQGVYMP